MASNLQVTFPIMRSIPIILLVFALSLAACSQSSEGPEGDIIGTDGAPVVEGLDDSLGGGTAGSGDATGTSTGDDSAAGNDTGSAESGT